MSSRTKWWEKLVITARMNELDNNELIRSIEMKAKKTKYSLDHMEKLILETKQTPREKKMFKMQNQEEITKHLSSLRSSSVLGNNRQLLEKGKGNKSVTKFQSSVRQLKRFLEQNDKISSFYTKEDEHSPEVAILTHPDNGKLLHLLLAAQWQICLLHCSPPSEAEEPMTVKPLVLI